MSLERLEAELAEIRAGHDPDGWALAAYRVAVARSESAAAGDLAEALDLLERAGRILTEARSPVEHARICTAAGQCHRRLGRPDRAAPLFERAAGLARDRAPAAEQAAALVNLGLALTETGRPDGAVEPLGRALDLLAGADGDEAGRVRAAALINRAQALQALGGYSELERAAADYRAAAAAAAADAPQRGMALHGLGSALLEQIDRNQAGGADSRGVDGAIGASERRGAGDAGGRSGGRGVDEAIGAFEQALGVLTEAAFPFQHAIARHSLAIAHERRGGPSDPARALAGVEAAMSIFDPRLHRPQWAAAADTLARLERTLEAADGPGTRADRFARLLAAVAADERTGLLRDRLARLAPAPEIRRRRELDGLASALTGLGPEEYETVMRSMVPVLMELPDPVLDSACAALAAAHRASGSAQAFDGALDRVIHDRLFGPQRVRVRDLLAANGWVRP